MVFLILTFDKHAASGVSSFSTHYFYGSVNIICPGEHKCASEYLKQTKK